MTSTEIANLFMRYRYEFKNKIPYPTNGESDKEKRELQEFKDLVNTFQERFKDYPIERLQFAFEQHLLNSNGYFPKTVELFSYFGIEKDDFGHVPSAQKTAELIRRQEELLERAKELDTKENRERLAEIHEEIRRKLEASTGKNPDGTASKFGTFRVDFDSE